MIRRSAPTSVFSLSRRRRRWRRIRPAPVVRQVKSQPSFRTDKKKTTPYMVAALVLVAIGVISMIPSPSGEEGCGIAKPELSEAAATPGVAGVVERYVVMSNPMPWGNSAAIVTRYWGDIEVSRWSMSDRRFQECSWNPVREAGSYVYDFPTRSGEVRHDLAAVSSKSAAQNELAGEWTSQFSGYQAYEIGLIDRILGWIRVFPESIVVAGLLFFWLSWRLAPRKVDAFGR